MDDDYFERQRQENLRRNADLFASLGIKRASSVLGSSTESSRSASPVAKKAAAAAAAKAKAKAKAKPRATKTASPATAKRKRGASDDAETSAPASAEATPRRTSLRIRGLDPSGKEAEKALAEQEEAAAKVVEAKQQRRSARILSLEDALREDRDGNAGRAAELMKGLASVGSIVDDDEEEEARKDASGELAAHFGKLATRHSAAVRVVPSRIYSMEFAPTDDKMLLCAGDKEGTLALWDLTEHYNDAVDAARGGESSKAPAKSIRSGDGHEDEDGDMDEAMVASDKLFSFTPHTEGLSQVMFAPGRADRLFSASYDGTLRILDMATQTFSNALILPSASRTTVQSMDMAAGESHLWFSTSDGGVGVVDLRAPFASAPSDSNTARCDYQAAWTPSLLDKKIGCISVNPATPTRLLVSSNDTTMRIFDSRWSFGARSLAPTKGATALADIGDALTEMAWGKHGYSCTAAYWQPRTGTGIISTCYDNYVRVWNEIPDLTAAVDAKRKSRDLSASKGEGTDDGDDVELPEPSHKISHNNKTGKWVTTLKAKWHPTLTNCALIGNMNRNVNVIDTARGRIVATLDDDSMTAVPAVVAVHPSARRPNIVVSGNASGKCHVWVPAGERE
ncbi:hypothetical protein H9P43_000106 [Blastocladiella emersonii ATCC 22665]|nr:hypothetical protein H9P43_000106 [Blastocladiella emersonii ATCC 22665]